MVGRKCWRRCGAPAGSDHVLVRVRLALVRCGKGAGPAQREGVAEHCFHVHPLCFFSPSSLFLFQLFYSLKTRTTTLQSGPHRWHSGRDRRHLQVPKELLPYEGSEATYATLVLPGWLAGLTRSSPFLVGIGTVRGNVPPEVPDTVAVVGTGGLSGRGGF